MTGLAIYVIVNLEIGEADGRTWRTCDAPSIFMSSLLQVLVRRGQPRATEVQRHIEEITIGASLQMADERSARLSRWLRRRDQ